MQSIDQSANLVRVLPDTTQEDHFKLRHNAAVESVDLRRNLECHFCWSSINNRKLSIAFKNIIYTHNKIDKKLNRGFIVMSS